MTNQELLSLYFHGTFLKNWELEERARNVAEGLVTAAPEFARGWHLLSIVYAQEHERALSYALRAAQLDGSDPLLLLHYCDLEIRYGNPRTVVKLLDELRQQGGVWGARAVLMRERI